MRYDGKIKNELVDLFTAAYTVSRSPFIESFGLKLQSNKKSDKKLSLETIRI